MVQWSYLSAVVYVTWWRIRQAVVVGPEDDVGFDPSLAMIGTDSKAVNAQSLYLLRALGHAGTARLTMMGWLDEEWQTAAQQSEAHERALLQWTVSTMPRSRQP